MESHLLKIKYLLDLAKNNANSNEAANASAMALKLIEKFKVSPAQLEEIEASDKPIYTDDNLMLETDTFADWKNILALAVANKYDCYAIQEENVLSTGEKSFKYFVYGEDEDVAIAKVLFTYVYDKIVELIEKRCPPDNELYRDSFGEGAANGVKVNIQYENFSSPGVVKRAEKPEVKPDAIAPTEKAPIKPPAIEKKMNVSKKDKPLDIIAYFIGEGMGREIHIGKMDLDKELPARTIDQLTATDLSKLFD